jgi:hypothetical protein
MFIQLLPSQVKCLAHIVGLVLIVTTICQGKTGDVLGTAASRSGRTVEKIEWEGTEKGFILITYPKSFKSFQPYHLNFWFPGTSGNPGFGIANENENYIEICTSYLVQESFAVGEYSKKHWALCQEFEEFLINRKQITVGQRIISGVSKGGWLAFGMSVEPPKDLDGVVIVAAGMYPREQRTPNFKGSKLAILVCTGETDSNYPFAQMAGAYYKKYKLEDYCYEEWLTKGHISAVSPRVIEWLNVQAKKGESKHALQVFSDTLVTKKLNEVEELDEPESQYIALRHLLKSPSYRHVSTELRERILNKGQGLNKDKAVIAWLKDYNILRKIVQTEVKLYQQRRVTSQEAAEIKAHFVKLANLTKYNTLKVRAAYGYLRNTKGHVMLKLQEKEKAKPEYKKMKKEFEDIQRRIHGDRKTDPILVDEFQELAYELRAKSTKQVMDSFYQVEWRKQYTVDDPRMKKLLETKQEALTTHKPYSGVSY